MKLTRLLVPLFVLFVLVIPTGLYAQQVQVKGVITDSKTGQPLSRATVRVKNGTASTITDDNGMFKLTAPSPESIITITYVGYQVYETKVGSGNLTVPLVNLGSDLNEVVVVAYGTQKKIHLTGAVSTLQVSKVEDIPSGNLSESLKGQLVGVNVSGGFARPGQAASISIRNPIFYSKDGGSKDPLYVIDDVIRTKADFDLLDASEIENVSVLKDAAAAIYGILGSNGAIIVRTKRGKIGKSSITYSFSYGLSDAIKMPKMLTGLQQAQYINDYYGGSKNWDSAATSLVSNVYTPDELDYFKTQPNYNWLKTAWQRSFQMRHTLNISGGSDRATYFAGLSYEDQNSNFPGAGYKRYSFRASSDMKLTTGLKLGLSLSGNIADSKNTFNKQGSESLDNDWKTLIGESPLYSPFINGLPILIPGAGTSSNINTYHYFAVHNLDNYTKSYNTGLNFQGSLTYEFPFIKGLRATVNYNKAISNSWGKQYGTKYNVYDFAKSGTHSHILGDSVIKTYTWTNGDRVRLSPSISNVYQFNTTLSYEKYFGKHQINLLAGYEQSEAFTDGVNAENDGVVVGGLDNMNFTTVAVISNEPTTESGRLAYFGRIDYNYASKYLLELQMRADASGNFAPENRWGYFPSMSAGWVISEEPFFEKISSRINYLKIRGSIGWLGIDNTKPYQWLRNYAIQTGKAAVFNGNNDRGLAVVTNLELANRDVQWDSEDKYNVGIDFSMFNSRLSVSADYYINKMFNMLSNLTSAPSILIGTAIPSENFGKANTFGYEVTANWKDKISRDWSYNVTTNFNWADNKQIIVDVAKGNIGTYLDPTGKSSDMGFLGYKSLGIIRTQADVDAILQKTPGYTIFGQAPKPGMLNLEDIRGPKDANGNYTGPDGKIDANDQDYLKKHGDNHYGLGINWGVTYRTLSLNVVMGMNWGGISSVESAARKVGNNPYQNRPAFWADHWTPTNTNAKYPSPYYSGTYDLATDFWWKSAFTFRVTGLNLSYSIPSKLLDKIKMNSARLYLVATNPINFFNPYDYKDNSNGSYDVFPVLKSFNFGLNVNL
jgi:TonB-linked SusC/RagA family outer membrane protein